RRDAGIGVEEVDALEVVRRVGGLHRDAFRRQPCLAGFGCRNWDRREVNSGEIRNAGHCFTCFCFTRRSISTMISRISQKLSYEFAQGDNARNVFSAALELKTSASTQI